MSSVDSRIVTMKFENSQFQQGVASTLGALAKLKDGLANLGKSTGLSSLSKEAGKVDLTPIAGQTHGISKAFVAMSTVAITALANITSSVQAQLGGMAKSLSGVKAMADGWSDYELKIGATQTIMAGTGLGIQAVTKHLKDLDIYADKTIYSLSDMTSNIGKFTNAGVKLPVAVEALKGVAQVAAVSGANSNEAARAMYNLGQAIGAGHVKLMDWKSVELANMGTKEFKEQLIQTAVEMGTLTRASDGTTRTLKGNEVDFKNFNMTLQDQWLTSKALTTTLGRYADENTKIGKKAYKASQQVKTFSMMMETLAAAAGTGWTDTFEIIIGNLPQATKLWTGITNSIGGFIGRQADARNEMLKTWADMGGRKALIEGLGNVFKALGAILKPIGEAFRDIFPRGDGSGLYRATEAFRKFTETLIISEDSAKAIGTVFKGVFAILGVGVDVAQGLIKSFFALAMQIGGTLGPPVSRLVNAIGGLIEKLFSLMGFETDLDSIFDGLIQARTVALQPILDFVAKLIDSLAALVSGGTDAFFASLSKSFSSIQPVLDKVAAGFEKIKQVAGDLWSDLSGALNLGSAASETGKEVSALSAAVATAGSVADKVKAAWDGLGGVFGGIGSFIAKAWEGIQSFFSGFKDKFSAFFSDMGIEEGLALVNTGFFIALYTMFARFTKNLGDVFDSLSGVLDQVTDNLKTMQTDVKADIILKIAGALAILAAALWVLATIPAKDLGKALGAAAAGMLIMVFVMKKLEGLVADNWKEAARSALNMTVMSVALAALAIAMLAFAGAVKILGSMDLASLAKGVGALAAILAVVVGAASILSKTGGAAQILIASAAILILSVALTAFAGAVKLYSTIDTGTLAEGTLKIALMMVALGLAFRAFPVNMLAISAGLLIVSFALTAIAGVMKIFGTFSVEEIVKSLIMLAGSLAIIAAALILMSGTLSGAAAILVFAGALAILTPALIALSGLSWGELAVGLAALAGVFIVVGLAGLVLAPLTPVILALAAAIGLLGLAALAVGAGLLLFATGMAALAASGAAGIAVLTAAVIGIAELFPLIMHQVGLGLIALAKVIAKAGPPLTAAITTLLLSVINAIIKVTPRFGKMLEVMISTGLRVLRALFPQVVATGIALIMALLDGVERNIGKITEKGYNIVIKFMDAVGKKFPQLVDKGAKMIIQFINGVADAIRNNQDQMLEAGRNLADAIIDGMVAGLGAGWDLVTDAAKRVAGAALDAAKNFLGIKSPSKEFEKLGIWVNKGFRKGLVGGLSEVQKGMSEMTARLKSEMENQRDVVAEEQEKLKSLLKEKDKDEKAIAAARQRLADAKAMYEASKAARDIWKKDLKDERTELIELSKQYDEFTTKIEEAQKALDDAIKTRDDAAKSIGDQYNRIPDINEETTVEDYAWLLNNEAQKNQKFLDSLNQLVQLGMDDATYKKLLDEGVGIQPFLDELIAAGPESIEAIDENAIALEKSAQDLGKRAAAELHQAGVDAAQGLLNGLQSKRAALEQEMREIAKLISKTVRKELKIKSPSRVFMEIGRYTNEGLALGLSKYSGVVEKSALSVGDVAVDTLRDTMARISDAVSAEADLNPTVAPVLDLSKLKKDASGISSMLSSKAMTAQVSYGQAASVSASRSAAQAAESSGTAKGETPVVQFVQNNTSPKALSHTEIYRATKNQLSLAKEALTNS